MINKIGSGITLTFLLLSFLLHAQEKRELVLLKNHGGLLPIHASEVGSIALIGNAASGIKKYFGDSISVFTARGVNKQNDISPLDSSMVYIGQGVHGFSAKYYNNLSATGTPARFATDKQIDLYRVSDTAAFSVSWDATLIPEHGPAKVKLLHNDGCRLYLDGKLLIDAWVPGPVRIDSAWLNIEKGTSYNIQVDYFHDGGTAMMKFGFDDLQEFQVREAVEKAAMVDIAVIFVGQPLLYNSNGNVERAYSIRNQSKLIRSVYEANNNTIVVLQTDSAVDIEAWAFDIPAIIQAWPPGENSGPEIAEVLLGQSDPSGKLPFRWTMNKTQNFDTRFPFGHGMTYTTFGIGKLLMDRDRDGNGWTATVEIRNVGERAGTETLQLYTGSKEKLKGSPDPGLRAIKKVTLLPGQKRTVALNVPYSSFEYTDPETGNPAIDPGMYEVLVGTSAEDIKLKRKIEIKQEYIERFYQKK